MKFGLCFHIKRVVVDPAHKHYRQIAGLDWARLRSYASFNFGRVQLRQTNTDPISLSNLLDCLSKHLHRFDTLVNFQRRYLNWVSNLGRATEDSSRNNSSLSFNLEAVIDGKEEIFLRSLISIGNLNLLQDLIEQIIDSRRLVFLSLESTHGHNLHIWAKFGSRNLRLQHFNLLLKFWRVFTREKIHFI